MKFSELPQEWQDKLNESRKDLVRKNHNGKWDLTLFNKEGTRYFFAHYNSPGGLYGFSSWTVKYGQVGFAKTKDKKGNEIYEWRMNFNKFFAESSNGTKIPKDVRTKKDAIEIAKKIGIFDI